MKDAKKHLKAHGLARFDAKFGTKEFRLIDKISETVAAFQRRWRRIIET